MVRPAVAVDPAFTARMHALRVKQGLSLRRLATIVHYSHGHVHKLETGQAVPTVDEARDIDRALGADGTLAALVSPATSPPASKGSESPSETVELLNRLHASDVSPVTVEALHAAVFELCCDYGWRSAHELRREGHGWLREVTRLLHLPVGLDQHRELLAAAGWLALLVGCVEYDMRLSVAAEAARVAARQIGQEAGHGEIVAWSWEMGAWFALTQGRYPAVVDAAEVGQAAIGEHTAAVQLIAQEAKAKARMGDQRGVRDALDRGHALLGKFPPPSRPDHHFVVDPDKWDFYAMDAYRLAGEDELAAHHAREVIRLGVAPDGTERTPMRMAEARLTLGTVAARSAELAEAVHVGLSAFRADRRSLPTLLMVGAELDLELRRRYPREGATDEFHEAFLAITDS